MNNKLLAIILFTLPLVAFAAPSKPVKHSHDGRSHTHPLPKTGTNHSHGKAKTTPQESRQKPITSPNSVEALNVLQRSKAPLLEEGKVKVYEPSRETESCGDWVSLSEERKTFHFLWFRGLMTGYNTAANVHRGRQLQAVSFATFQAYLDKTCRDNPLEPMMRYVFKLVRDLEKRS